MTEKEAIKYIEKWYHPTTEPKERKGAIEALAVVYKALEELQQYREIGTIEELAMGKRCISLVKKHGTIGEMIDECVAYEEIGTVEECREAREKQKAKKPVKRSFVLPYEGINVCPNCKEPINKKEHHCKCGQAIDWSEKE